MNITVLSTLLLLISCSTKTITVKETLNTPSAPIKEFAPGEIILGNHLLTKIFDQEMAPLMCVPDIDEASLLLRTIRPRLEVVQDDLEAILDQPEDVEKLVLNCTKNCTCSFVDDLLREHLVILPKKLRKSLDQKKVISETNRCLNYVQSTFCQSDLYKQLNLEKADFSFEDSP